MLFAPGPATIVAGPYLRLDGLAGCYFFDQVKLTP
jgi:hypothetical protein